ncbi:MAG: ACT domain-containing protein [Chloroflexi bacterium]|nr:ACT domain-containing protein [Chloroflexota bacterium]
MATDLTVGLVDRPGSLARASDVLGRAGINVEGASGYLCDGQGVFHVLVVDAERARRALIDSGFEIQAERQVVTVPVENRPGEGARLLRRLADANVNIDLIYTTLSGELVLGTDDLAALQAALG